MMMMIIIIWLWLQFSRDQTLLPYGTLATQAILNRILKLGYNVSFGNFHRFKQKTTKSHGWMSASYTTYITCRG